MSADGRPVHRPAGEDPLVALSAGIRAGRARLACGDTVDLASLQTAMDVLLPKPSDLGDATRRSALLALQDELSQLLAELAEHRQACATAVKNLARQRVAGSAYLAATKQSPP